jgi:hypothetical protein
MQHFRKNLKEIRVEITRRLASTAAPLELATFQNIRQKRGVGSDGECPLGVFLASLEVTGDELGGRILEVFGSFDLSCNFKNPGPNIIKLFMAVIYMYSLKANVCPWQAFPATKVFVSRARGYLSTRQH